MIKTIRSNDRQTRIADFDRLRVFADSNTNVDFIAIGVNGNELSYGIITVTSTPQLLVTLLNGEDTAITSGRLTDCRLLANVRELKFTSLEGTNALFQMDVQTDYQNVNDLVVGSFGDFDDILRNYTYKRVNNVSELKSLAPEDGDVAVISNDYQFTPFCYDEESTKGGTNGNDYTHIKPNDKGGRWRLLQTQNGLNILDFGAIPLPMTASAVEQDAVANGNRMAILNAFLLSSFWGGNVIIPTVARNATNHAETMTFFIDEPLRLIWSETDDTGTKSGRVIGGGNITPKHTRSWDNEYVVQIRGGVTDADFNILIDEDGITGVSDGFEEYLPPFCGFLYSRGPGAEDTQWKDYKITVIGGTDGPSVISVCGELINWHDSRWLNTLGYGTFANLLTFPINLIDPDADEISGESTTRIFINNVNMFNYNNAGRPSQLLEGGAKEIEFVQCYSYVEYGPHRVLIGDNGKTATNPFGWSVNADRSIHRFAERNCRYEYNMSASAPNKALNRIQLAEDAYLRTAVFEMPFMGETSSNIMYEFRDCDVANTYLRVEGIQDGYTGRVIYLLRSTLTNSDLDLNAGYLEGDRTPGVVGSLNTTRIRSMNTNPLVTTGGFVESYNNVAFPMGTQTTSGQGERFPGILLNSTVDTTLSSSRLDLPMATNFARITSGTVASNLDYIATLPAGGWLFVRNESANTMTIRHNIGSVPTGYTTINTFSGASRSLTTGQVAIFRRRSNGTAWELWGIVS